MKQNNDILTPAEWLEKYDPDLKKWINYGGVTTMYDIKNMLSEYARHVAARVASNTRGRAEEIVGEYGPEMGEIQDRITNIPLRDVYPVGQKEETE